MVFFTLCLPKLKPEKKKKTKKSDIQLFFLKYFNMNEKCLPLKIHIKPISIKNKTQQKTCNEGD